MKFNWTHKPTYDVWSCHSREPVTVTNKDSLGNYYKSTTADMGYITRSLLQHHLWVANTYGTINPTSPSLETPDLDVAKRYVEEQAIVGITVNKLTR